MAEDNLELRQVEDVMRKAEEYLSADAPQMTTAASLSDARRREILAKVRAERDGAHDEGEGSTGVSTATSITASSASAGAFRPSPELSSSSSARDVAAGELSPVSKILAARQAKRKADAELALASGSAAPTHERYASAAERDQLIAPPGRAQSQAQRRRR